MASEVDIVVRINLISQLMSNDLHALYAPVLLSACRNESIFNTVSMFCYEMLLNGLLSWERFVNAIV